MFPHNRYDDGGFSAVIGVDTGDPKQVHVHPDHPAHDELWEAVKNENTEAFLELYTIENKIKKDFEGTAIRIENGAVYYGQTQLNNAITDAILEYLSDGEPVEHLVRFLDKSLDNPSEDSVEQLYNFTKTHGLQITDEGDLVGYKSVRDDYLDHHSGEYLNEVGESHKMPRSSVLDDPSRSCGPGFHVGTLEYAKGFKSHISHRVMICKVNPRDVVSIPNGHISNANHQKVRVARYKVIGEMD